MRKKVNILNFPGVLEVRYILTENDVKLSLFLGEHVAQFKFTVLLMPNGPHKITGLPFEEELFSSEHSVKDADIQVLSCF